MIFPFFVCFCFCFKMKQMVCRHRLYFYLELSSTFLLFSLCLSVCLLDCDKMLFGHCSSRGKNLCNVCHCRKSICLSLKCLSVTKASVCLRFPIIKVPVCHYPTYCLNLSLPIICVFTLKHNTATVSRGCMVLCGHRELFCGNNSLLHSFPQCLEWITLLSKNWVCSCT